MSLFNKKNEGGLMDAIRCDEPDYLIWKWRPKGQEANSTNKENAIRFGSSLNVKEGEVAVFVYNQKDGIQQDFITGPYNDTIKTSNFPVLANIIGAAFGGATPFQAEVYYINLAGLIKIPFAIPFFDIFDPRFMDFPVPVAVRGSIAMCITNYKEFIKLHRLIDFNIETFKEQIKDTLIKYIKGTIVTLPNEHSIPVIQIESKILLINNLIHDCLKENIESLYGITIRALDISAIEIDKQSEGFRKIQKLTADFTEAQISSQQNMTISNAETANRLQMENMQESQRIQMKNMEEALRIQREEGQFAQHSQTQANVYAQNLSAEQANIAAFGIKSQSQVGIASAEALGKMNASGAGSINLGSANANTGNMNPAAMMTNMAMGAAVGQGMANMMGNAFNNIPAPNGLQATKLFNVAVNGQPSGPYSADQIKQMISSSQINQNTLLWTAGMSTWLEASQIPEFSGLFSNVPPVPPPLK